MASKGDEFYAKGEKTLTKFTLFGNKYEDAREHFEQAATYYKAATEWEKAGNAYLKCEELSVKLKSAPEAATYLADAGNMFKKVNLEKAAECMERVLIAFDKEARFGKSAKIALELAELYEKERQFEKCVDWYIKAADYYRGEGSITTSNTCRVKVAQYQALAEKYDEAIEIYESVASTCTEDNLLKANAKGYAFLALLCSLAQPDLEKTKAKFEEYQEKDSLFDPSTREHAFVTAVIEALEEQDMDKFRETYDNWENISPFDDFKAKLLLRCKHRLKNPDMC
eukprot:NODE_4602_length_1041_cov_52.269063_g4399_i0.p1 GENE.NODE_4602_length_1041_cov_52.269063_g4399_i0~~NODE_4602_length_1041_cov_52.269063_g4399_i0.p1  ORF type:complete len:301 (+),score=89.74 NODE_4602_length_1041_cov_52.269063_g4399_i0:56-904(+)